MKTTISTLCFALLICIFPLKGHAADIYSNAVSYNPGDEVMFNGQEYVCKNTVPAGSYNSPSQSSWYWGAVSSQNNSQPAPAQTQPAQAQNNGYYPAPVLKYVPPADDYKITSDLLATFKNWITDNRVSTPMPSDAKIFTNITADGTGIIPHGQEVSAMPANINEEFFYFNSPVSHNVDSAEYQFIINDFANELDKLHVSYIFLFNDFASARNISACLSSKNLKFAILAGDGYTTNPGIDQGSPYTSISPYSSSEVVNNVNVNSDAAIMILDCMGFSDIGLALVDKGATQVFGSYNSLDSNATQAPACICALVYLSAQKNQEKCSITDAFKYTAYRYSVDGKTGAGFIGKDGNIFYNNFIPNAGVYSCYDAKYEDGFSQVGDSSLTTSIGKADFFNDTYSWPVTISNNTGKPINVQTLLLRHAYPGISLTGADCQQYADSSMVSSTWPNNYMFTNLIYSQDPYDYQNWTKVIGSYGTGNLLTTYNGAAVWHFNNTVIAAGGSLKLTLKLSGTYPYSDIELANLGVNPDDVKINPNGL